MNFRPVDHENLVRTLFPHATIDLPCEIGETSEIWRVHIMRNARIGERCVLGDGVHVGPRVVVGNRCKIQNGAQLFEGVTLEDEVFVGPHAVFTNVTNPRAFIERKAEFKLTLVKRGASIGANATILCGVTIGEYAMIGAGAVVTQDVPAHYLVVGVPARRQGFVCRCGVPFNEATAHEETNGVWVQTCQACGDRYSVTARDESATFTLRTP